MPRAKAWFDPPWEQQRPPDTPADVVFEGEPRCDFCEARTVVARYDCPDFTTDGRFLGEPLIYFSVGDWAACGTCTSLIEAGDTAGLVEQVLTAHRGFNHQFAPLIREEHEAFHRRQIEQFMTLRSAAPRTIAAP